MKWLQERLGQARASAAGGTEAMAEPGPHPSSQPNTPRRPGSPWLAASGFLSFLNLPALAITADWDRISSPRLPSSTPSVQALPTSREVTPAPGHRESLAPADPPPPPPLGPPGTSRFPKRSASGRVWGCCCVRGGTPAASKSPGLPAAACRTAPYSRSLRKTRRGRGGGESLRPVFKKKKFNSSDARIWVPLARL